jgi:hypothetical protein
LVIDLEFGSRDGKKILSFEGFAPAHHHQHRPEDQRASHRSARGGAISLRKHLCHQKHQAHHQHCKPGGQSDRGSAHEDESGFHFAQSQPGLQRGKARSRTRIPRHSRQHLFY